MHSNLNTMMGVIAYYPLEEYMEWYNESVTLDGRKQAVKLCEYILPFLNESLQKHLYSGLMYADDTLPLVSIDNIPKYVSLYLQDLFFIVERIISTERIMNNGITALNNGMSGSAMGIAAISEISRVETNSPTFNSPICLFPIMRSENVSKT